MLDLAQQAQDLFVVSGSIVATALVLARNAIIAFCHSGPPLSVSLRLAQGRYDFPLFPLVLFSSIA